MVRAICFRNWSRVGSRIVGGLGFRLRSSSEPPLRRSRLKLCGLWLVGPLARCLQSCDDAQWIMSRLVPQPLILSINLTLPTVQ